MKTEHQLLKLTGILMLVFGGLGVLLYTAGLAVVLGVTYVTKGVFSGSSDLLGVGLLLGAAGAELIAGILGIRAAKKPERAGAGLLIWGSFTLLLTLAGMGLIALRATGTPWWQLASGFGLGLIVPGVYLVAAVRVLKDAETEEKETDSSLRAE